MSEVESEDHESDRPNIRSYLNLSITFLVNIIKVRMGLQVRLSARDLFFTKLYIRSH